MNINNYRNVLDKLSPYGAKLIVVSKYKSFDEIETVKNWGQNIFGENYVLVFSFWWFLPSPKQISFLSMVELMSQMVELMAWADRSLVQILLMTHMRFAFKKVPYFFLLGPSFDGLFYLIQFLTCFSHYWIGTL